MLLHVNWCLCFLVCASEAKANVKKRLKNRHLAFQNDILDKTVLTRSPQILFYTVADRVSPLQRGIVYEELVLPREENCAASVRQIMNLKQQVKCMPRQTIVELISERQLNIEPKAVLVKRCGGTCSSIYECVPAMIEDRKFYIKQYRKDNVFCSSVIVPEHTKCKCQCKQQESDCTSKQIYRRNACACECKDEERSKCINKGYKFDETKCTCNCVKKNCTTGTVWDLNKCKCILARYRRNN